MFSGAKATVAARSIRLLKTQNDRYLEDKWIWRYIYKLKVFVQIINNWVNRSFLKTPTTVRKKFVINIIAGAKQKQQNKVTTEPFVGDKDGIASRNMLFRKS